MINRFTFWTFLCGLVLLVALRGHAQSARDGWGAVPYADAAGTGVTFRVWAANAAKINVAGDFNGWQTNSTALTLQSPPSAGVWSADVPAARAGDAFRYSINDEQFRRDPRSRQVVHSSDEASIIYDSTAYGWNTREFIPPPLEELVLYELHIGTYYHPDDAETPVGTFEQAIEKLDHVAMLGANAVQLMPVAEFPGDNSWGYNPSDPFAVESAYGGPDGFKAFVDACHERGLAVILDVVHNHYGPGDLEYSLWEFDGWSGPEGGGIYFYQEEDNAETPWGPRPDYSRPEVRQYIIDNIRMWLEEYRVDGFRWDAVMFMRLNSTFQPITDGERLLREIGEMMAMEFPEKIHIAEDLLNNPLVTAPLDEPEGLGFDSDWSRKFHVDITAQLTNSLGRDLGVMADQMRFTGGVRRVIYTESHDEVGYLNVDEGAQRFTTELDAADPFSYMAQKSSTLGAALVMSAPGIPMLFQGQEMLENNIFSTTNAMDWAKTDTYGGIVRFYKDIVQLRRNLDGVSRGLQGAFSSVSVTNNGTMLLVHRGMADEPEDDVFVVANISASPVEGYWIDFPHPGEWHVHVNSDDTQYSSDYAGFGSEHVSVFPDGRGNVYVAPMSVLMLSQHPPGPPDGDRDGIPDAWEIQYGLDPNDPTDAWLNPDGDALTNLQEYQAGTDPMQRNFPPSEFQSIHVAGDFNGWNTSIAPMVLIADRLWQRDLVVPASSIEFKLVANETWDVNWGIPNQTRFVQPITRDLEGLSEDNIVLTNLQTGVVYRVRFDERRLRFTLRAVPFADSDNDGIPDEWELEHGLDPFSSHDALLFPDGDLFTNLDKYRFGLTPGTWEPPLTDFDSMGVIFGFNGWNVSDMNMSQSLDAHYTWTLETNLFQPRGIAFRIAANGSWDNDWGDWNPEGSEWPLQGAADTGGTDIHLQNGLAGLYRFAFNERTGAYSVDFVESDWTPPTFSSMALAGSFNGWDTAPNMTQEGAHMWTYTGEWNHSDGVVLKVAADGGWDVSWGLDSFPSNAMPVEDVLELDGGDMVIEGPLVGVYAAHFDTSTYTFSLKRDGPLPNLFDVMAVAGSFNGWNTTPNMTLNTENEWVLEMEVIQGGPIEFKFASGGWTDNWGDDATHVSDAPATGTAIFDGLNIVVPGPFDGMYRFTFSDYTLSYRVEPLDEETFPFGHVFRSAPGDGLVLQWPSVVGAVYDVYQTSSLHPGLFTNVAPSLVATPPMNTWTATIPSSVASGFFQIRRAAPLNP